jgi:hypothetical protein
MDKAAEKFGHLVSQMYDAFYECNAQGRPDLLLFLREYLEEVAREYDLSFIDFMSEIKRLKGELK